MIINGLGPPKASKASNLHGKASNVSICASCRLLVCVYKHEQYAHRDAEKFEIAQPKMKSDNPWLVDTMLLAMPARGWFTMPEILKRVSPLGIASSPAKFIGWKFWRVFRWTERRMLAGASGRRPNGQTLPGGRRRELGGVVYEYRLTVAGRAERAALERELRQQFERADFGL